MFMRSRERSSHWEAGYKPEDSQQLDTDEEKYFRAEPWAPGSGGSGPTPVTAISLPPTGVETPSSANLPLTTFVFAPKLPTGDKVDKDRLDALSSEELERVMMPERKSMHTNVGPKVCCSYSIWH